MNRSLRSNRDCHWYYKKNEKTLRVPDATSRITDRRALPPAPRGRRKCLNARPTEILAGQGFDAVQRKDRVLPKAKAIRRHKRPARRRVVRVDCWCRGTPMPSATSHRAERRVVWNGILIFPEDVFHRRRESLRICLFRKCRSPITESLYSIARKDCGPDFMLCFEHTRIYFVSNGG